MENLTLDWKKYSRLAVEAVSEGCVLLENRNDALPLQKGCHIAVFGRIQLDYYKSGTGSGGLVNAPYVHSILDALLANDYLSVDETVLKAYREWTAAHPFDNGTGWANEPCCQEEMPADDIFCAEAARRCEAAIIIIGRSCGEDHDNLPEKGSYYLTDTEEALIRSVCTHFSKTIVLLNTGNVIDMEWTVKYKPDAVMYVWQGGMEGGTGAVRVLTGEAPACGHLTDTICKNLNEHPASKNFGHSKNVIYQEDIYTGYRYFETFARDAVRYPFGYGLTYTSFSHKCELAPIEDTIDSKLLSVSYKIKNTGAHPGKDVLQFYIEAPQGRLGKPLRQLVGFVKTRLLAPGESEAGSINIPFSRFASYDDCGLSGHSFCFLLEAGEYMLYGGENVRDAKRFSAFCLDDLIILEHLSQQLAPVVPFCRIVPTADRKNGLIPAMEAVPTKLFHSESDSCDLDYSDYSADMGYKLADVKNGTVSMKDFLSQLSDEALCAIIKGEGMCSPKVTPGTAAAFGGITKELTAFGIPAGCCSDGPSGMRLDCGTNAFSLPGGTLLACTFNTELISELFEMEGLEMRSNRIDTILGPGMNIHRHPLNGRNFEYFSEDPLLTGLIAAAELKGLKKSGVSGTIKHFCGNNQEQDRQHLDSILSERALREIYLKGFEIAVKSGYADSIMTTYGCVNSQRTACSKDLNTSILRKEWNFKGMVMTDWWTLLNNSNEAENSNNYAAMVSAQNDVYMTVSDTEASVPALIESLHKGTLKRSLLMRCAANICSFLINSPAMLRLCGEDIPVTQLNIPENAATTSEFDIAYYDAGISADFSLENIPHSKGDTYMMGINTKGYGEFSISLTASSTASALAQIPVTVSVDNVFFGTYSFTGTEGKPVTITRTGRIFGYHHYIKLFFAQDGLEIANIHFELTSLESKNHSF